MPDQLSTSQSASRLIELLGFEGYVTPSKADILRRLGKIRNRVAHGDLGQTASPSDVAEVLSVVKTLAGFLPVD